MGKPSANYKGRQTEQDYKFTCILYPDSTTYDCDLILRSLDYHWKAYYYIFHDSDTYTLEDVEAFIDDHLPDVPCPFNAGDLKKPHYHVVAISSSPCKLGLATKKFQLICSNDELDQSHIVQRVQSLDYMIPYLTHLNAPDKFQYKREDVHYKKAFPPDKYYKQFDLKNNMEKVFIYLELTHCTSFTECMRFMRSEGLYKEIHSMQGIIRTIIQENSFTSALQKHAAANDYYFNP